MLPQVERPGSLEKIITALQAVLKLLRPFDAPEPWRKLTLLNGWVLEPALGLYEDPLPPGFRKDPLGRVYLRGWLDGAAAAGGTIAVLPATHRPSHVVYLTQVIVLPDGSIIPNVALGADVFLGEISFDTEL